MRITDSTHIHRPLSTIDKRKTQLQKTEKTGSGVEYRSSSQTDSKENIIYSPPQIAKYSVSKTEIERLKQEHQDSMREGFMQMAQEIVADQAVGYRQALAELLDKGKIDPEKIEQAKLNLAEGGFWSVDKTSGRIISLAKALAGNDPEKATQIKKGFLQGFAAAEQAWGGQLPDICYQTKEAVLAEFESWPESDS